MRYAIALTPAQATVVSTALELYARLLIGQPEHIANVFKIERMTEVRDALDALKAVAFPELAQNASYGIHSDKVSDKARQAFDIYSVIRHAMHEHNQDKHTPWHTDAMEPHRTSREENLPEIWRDVL